MANRLSMGMRNLIAEAVRAGLANGVIDIYSGAQPSSSDSAETGTLLARITVSSGAFTPGVSTNGLNFGAAVNGRIDKTGVTWSGLGLAAGVAGWARFYSNAVVTGASTTSVRWDFSIATTGATMVMASTSVTVGGEVIITSAYINIPAS